ncbi:hypothetical protein WOLCODRAFT_90452 [Wolfiporia cocos MD-104 SS10]|uniref:Uncharacterized protein n=1 Tax=Wolfiporia cocos (strain MD-104) TaxID=742152 RepID=A0A2H3K0T2_WOLCO|nr:hypothetical protein WOLCODRAFT_90452 [Wolfiporia cocos MD-104 SS10]
MGTWHVTHSTLPLWRNRKDVTITYVARLSAGKPAEFDDIVEYRAKSAPPTSTRSRIVGVDKLVVPLTSISSSGTSADPGPSTRFKWRGKGWLMIASSRWQILGCGFARDRRVNVDSADDGDADVPSRPPDSTPQPEIQAEWALTYFEKTLFTPAGMDIYARAPQGLPDELLQEIIRKAQALGGVVGALATQFFEVERSRAV